jgi:N-acetylglucosamine kinase-like BadF-type ATPase
VNGSIQHIVAVDGGNSKTDVLIVTATGRVLAQVRGAGVRSPHGDPALWAKKLTTLVDEARIAARVPIGVKAACAVYYLANVDLPSERRVAQRELHGSGQALSTFVHNDTLAVLRAGASRPWGIAVVAGAGINAVGVHPSGRLAGFLALGYYTGDSGGGRDIGVRGLALAVRARDGRGRPTSLATSVPAFYGLRNPGAVAVAVHHGEISTRDFIHLAPLVFAASADGDEVATGILADFADEVATMAGALIRRLRLVRTDVEVVLGGGTLQTGVGWISDRVQQKVAEVAPEARVTVLDVPPVFGAVVEAFDRAGLPARGKLVARRSLLAGSG